MHTKKPHSITMNLKLFSVCEVFHCTVINKCWWHHNTVLIRRTSICCRVMPVPPIFIWINLSLSENVFIRIFSYEATKIEFVLLIISQCCLPRLKSNSQFVFQLFTLKLTQTDSNFSHSHVKIWYQHRRNFSSCTLFLNSCY